MPADAKAALQRIVAAANLAAFDLNAHNYLVEVAPGRYYLSTSWASMASLELHDDGHYYLHSLYWCGSTRHAYIISADDLAHPDQRGVPAGPYNAAIGALEYEGAGGGAVAAHVQDVRPVVGEHRDQLLALQHERRVEPEVPAHRCDRAPDRFELAGDRDPVGGARVGAEEHQGYSRAQREIDPAMVRVHRREQVVDGGGVAAEHARDRGRQARGFRWRRGQSRGTARRGGARLGLGGDSVVARRQQLVQRPRQPSHVVRLSSS